MQTSHGLLGKVADASSLLCCDTPGENLNVLFCDWSLADVSYPSGATEPAMSGSRKGLPVPIELSYKQLRDACRELELPIFGTQAILHERLLPHPSWLA